METPDTYLIGLAGHRYQVRVVEGRREIFSRDRWTGASEFVDALAELGEWGQVCELAKLGHSILNQPTP